MRFATRHNYSVHLETDLRSSRPPAWSKILLIEELLHDFDLVFWVDADAAIIDVSRDIAADLPQRRAIGVVEHHYGGQSVPNAGVMILRRRSITRRFLHKLWKSEHRIDDPWWDNAALLDLLGYQFTHHPDTCRAGSPTRYLKHTEFLPLEWNSISMDSADEPRIVHAPGVPIAQRLKTLQDAIEGTKA